MGPTLKASHACGDQEILIYLKISGWIMKSVLYLHEILAHLLIFGICDIRCSSLALAGNWNRCTSPLMLLFFKYFSKYLIVPIECAFISLKQERFICTDSTPK